MRRFPIRLSVLALGCAGATCYAVARSAPSIASAREDVLSRLANMGKIEVKEWRWRHGENEAGADPALDDSSWDKVAPGHRWTGENTEGWYRASIEMPRKVAGFDALGSTVDLEIGVDDFGEIWVDGKKREDFQWDKGRVVLTEKAQAGERHLVAIRARNRSGPGRLLRARLTIGAIADTERAVGDYVEALKIARKIAAVLGGSDARWSGILERSAEMPDLGAADRGDRGAFIGSLENAKKELSSLKELTAGYRIRCAGYSHIDLAWLWRWAETVQVCKETFASALNFAKEFPDFRFSMSQSHAYRWIEERYPELFEGIREAVKSGAWEIVGGTSVELDCNLPDAESHIRQLMQGQRYFREKFGKTAKIGWCPDSFGYNGNLPQILKKSGIDYFVTSKISWNDTNKFPHNLFWWEAPDGSRVLTFLPLGGYNNELEGEPMIDHLKEVETQTGTKDILMVYGVGNHGGGPTREMLERERRLERLDFYPKIEKSTAIGFFDGISPQAREKLPVWRDELYLEYHRGTYTTQAANKRANRKGEVGLVTAEKLAAAAGLLGAPYPAADLERAWDFLLFNQMHDILPGSSITPVYRDSAEDYAAMFARIDAVSERSLAAIDAALAPALPPSERRRLVVFNPLSWERDDVATCELGPEDTADSWIVRDPAGAECASQITLDEQGRRSLIFEAKAMPAMGYRVYTRTPGTGEARGRIRVGGSGSSTIENEVVKVAVDRASGNVTSVEHRPTGKQALSAPGNRLQLLEDRPKVYDAWELGFTGKEWNLDRALSVEMIETGPVRATIRVKKTFLGDTKQKQKPTEDFPSSFFTQDVSVYGILPWVETRFSADWWEDHVCAKVAFPLAVKTDTATYEIPYATLERSTKRETAWEKARYEVSGQKWADLSADGFGVSLLNESKYGYDALGSVLRLTCMRAPTSPDASADRGKHAFRYALYPHAGTWRDGGTVRAAYQFNHPLVVTSSPTFAEQWGGTSFARGAIAFSERGSVSPPPGVKRAPLASDAPVKRGALPSPLPAELSFVTVDAPNVIVTVVKRAQDSGALAVRLYEWAGTPSTDVTLTFPFTIASASVANLLEEEPKPAAVSGRTVKLRCAANAIETILVVPQ